MYCKEPTTASTVPNHTLPQKHNRARNKGRCPSHVPVVVAYGSKKLLAGKSARASLNHIPPPHRPCSHLTCPPPVYTWPSARPELKRAAGRHNSRHLAATVPLHSTAKTPAKTPANTPNEPPRFRRRAVGCHPPPMPPSPPPSPSTLALMTRPRHRTPPSERASKCDAPSFSSRLLS